MASNEELTFFDVENKLDKLETYKDPLKKLNEKINWEIFRNFLQKIFEISPKGPGGRPRFDFILMFKIIILQRYYNLSDDQIEYQINDRFSFMRFLGLTIKDTIPDAKTIWCFKETLKQQNAVEDLFNIFNSHLEEIGLFGNKGSIVDASFVDVPKQRNNREENKEIKEGKIPEEWQKDENKLRQKDTDARWTKKNNETHYGYKDHVKVDKESKLIESYTVTSANTHDSQELKNLVNDEDGQKDLYADSAYTGEEIENTLEEKKINNKIHEKGYRNNPLTDEQKEANKEKSKTRVRVEHVFGFIENSMHGSKIKTIGIDRAAMIIGLINLTYNMFRAIQIS